MTDADIFCRMLGELVNRIREVSTLLQDDLDFFRRNDVSAIEQNNIKKNEANDKLVDSLTQFNSLSEFALSQGNLYEQFLQYVTKQSRVEQSRMNPLLVELNSELETYKQLLTINRQLVTANLDFVKDLFASLTDHQNAIDKVPTYDRQGLLERA